MLEIKAGLAGKIEVFLTTTPRAAPQINPPAIPPPRKRKDLGEGLTHTTRLKIDFALFLRNNSVPLQIPMPSANNNEAVSTK